MILDQLSLAQMIADDPLGHCGVDLSIHDLRSILLLDHHDRISEGQTQRPGTAHRKRQIRLGYTFLDDTKNIACSGRQSAGIQSDPNLTDSHFLLGPILGEI